MTYRLSGFAEPPKVEGLNVEWVKAIHPDTIVAFRKLRKTKLLQIYSMQHYAIFTGKCVPDSDYCVRLCQAKKKEEDLVGVGGPIFCSLVRALLAVEFGFYRMSVAQGGDKCDLCGEEIKRGYRYVSAPLFGYKPLSLCMKCVMYSEYEED